MPARALATTRRGACTELGGPRTTGCHQVLPDEVVGWENN